MDKQLLHIIPYIPKYEDKIKQVDKEELDNAYFWYLHGSLVDIFHFDKAVMTNCKSMGISKTYTNDNGETINKLCYNGGIECEVEGCDKPCIAFLYTRNNINGMPWMQRGLVCIKDDIDACRYANEKMIKKSKLL